ncbi:hypothetical protein [Mariprofundus ferrooxydans]|uniref:Arginine decarboxylase n=1 Tax=Mariprofundus ferrooxydans PV-1 TaxID=314345 RepID=Q0F006_9PROT|nr:hypothetical protein [Mariprofundus ferrooxydans]EAU54878.1 arginine decarboxylase [Mariprofundus ferrooxydans PV-1]KON46810.1 arginine decarboxylase [Mariprofundus ferrooxydans]
MGHVKHRRSEESEFIPEFPEPKRSKKDEKRWRKHAGNDDDEWGDDAEWSDDFDSLSFDDDF